MSVLTVRPQLDTIVELELERPYFLVTVAWEYYEQRYVMVQPTADPNPIAADFTPWIAAMPRDEGFVITKVERL